MWAELLKIANIHDKNQRYILADALDKFLIKLSNKKFVVEPKKGYWIAHVDFANKQHAKNAGFLWRKWDPSNPTFSCWGTDKPNIIHNLDKNIWDVVNKSDLKTITTSETNDLNLDVTYDGVQYYVKGLGTHQIKDQLKKLNFRWDPSSTSWTTTNKEAAEALKSAKDLTNYLDSIADYDRSAYQKSFQATPNKELNLIQPANPNIRYYPYQEVAVEYALDKFKKDHGVILGDPTGLGKTGESIAIINQLQDVNKILIISTAKTKMQWEKELKDWLARDLSIGIVEKDFWPATDIVICSYGMLGKFKAITDRTTFDLIVADEGHKFKNKDSQRAKNIIGSMNENTFQYQGGLKAKHKLVLTATPIANRPHELWTLMHFIDPIKFPHYGPFKKEYGIWKSIEVGAKKKEDPNKNPLLDDEEKKSTGTRRTEVYMGPQNLDQLNRLLRSEYMIRRNKEEVQKDLPPKTRRIIELKLSGDLPAQTSQVLTKLGVDKDLDNLTILKGKLDEKARLEKIAKDHPTKELLSKISELSNTEHQYIALLEKLNTTVEKNFEKIAEMRRIDGIEKAPSVVQHILDLLEESPNQKLTVFAHHKDVIAMIKNGVEQVYPESVIVVVGGTSDEKLFHSIKEFQTNPQKKVFLGSLQAVKEGVNGLQKASSHIIFAEFSYVPSDMEQAEGRLHRNLQDQPVLIDYMVKHNSLDAHMAQLVARKLRMIEKALDPNLGVTPQRGAPVEPIQEIKQVDKEINQVQEQLTSSGLTKDQQDAIREGILMMNGSNPDGAREINGVGFNKMDSEFGRSLANFIESKGFLSPKQYMYARNLLNKYRKTQLPPEIVQRIWPA